MNGEKPTIILARVEQEVKDINAKLDRHLNTCDRRTEIMDKRVQSTENSISRIYGGLAVVSVMIIALAAILTVSWGL